MAPSRLDIALKYLQQVGLTQAALFVLYRFGLKTGHYRRLEESQQIKSSQNSLSEIKQLFTFPRPEKMVEVIGEQGLDSIVTNAREISTYQAGAIADLLTFEDELHHWTEYESGSLPFPEPKYYRIFEEYHKENELELQDDWYTKKADIKFVWEPARFGWAYLLSRAYYLTKDESFAEAFWENYEAFLDSNPPYLGPNWMSGQEVAIRLMVLVWADQVFQTAAASSAERRARLARSVAAHAARIPPTLVYARAQNNNHLVTEAAGLYTAGLALPDHPQASEWRALGWRWLNWAFRHQISSYGEYIQQSTNYHRVMLQTALWVNAIKDADWPGLTLQSLGRATHWLFSMLDPASGRTPNLGANDSALILPLSVTPFNDFRPTVQAAARAFLRFQMPGGVWDEMSLWLGLDEHEKAYESSLYLADHLRGPDSWAYLRATQFPSRLGHMDQLHLDLWWHGLNVAQDAGTYLYNADPPWDNPLVSTRIHNTVTVDGQDQMTRGGRFMTLDWFPAYSKSVVPIDDTVLGQVVGYHNGYPGVRHERTVRIYTDERWVVEDELTSDEPHIYRLHWLLPDWEWKTENGDTGFGIRLKSSFGWIALRILAVPQLPANDSHITLIRAGERLAGAGAGEGEVLPFEGWASPTYGEKIPALSLAFEVQSEQTMKFTTEFIFPHAS
jgi:hypothetical protein